MTERGSVLPLWLKIGFTLWMAFWIPATVVISGPQNFLWLCNIANFLILAGLWLESRLLMSAQLLAVLLIGLLWGLDVGVALVSGVNPIGGTEYMFNEAKPLGERLVSLYHLMLPVVAVYSCMHLGYDRRALGLQTLITWLVLPPTRWFTGAERNINWVYGPFGEVGEPFAPWLYMLALMALWPLALYVPTHLLARALWGRGRQAKLSDSE